MRDRLHYHVYLVPRPGTPSEAVWRSYSDKVKAANEAGKLYVCSLGAQNVTFRSPMQLVGAVWPAGSELPQHWKKKEEGFGLTYAYPKNTKGGREISARLKELSFADEAGRIVEAEGICPNPDWRLIGNWSVMSSLIHLSKLDRFIVVIPVAREDDAREDDAIVIPESYHEITERECRKMIQEHNALCGGEK